MSDESELSPAMAQGVAADDLAPDPTLGDPPPNATAEEAAANPEPPVRKPRHFAGFDGLRAIAAVSVLLLHTAWVSGFTLRSQWGAYTSRLEIGVSIFFLISGFLLYRPFAISHLAGEESPSTRRFFERRLLRIVPAYWLALTVLTYVFHAVSVGGDWQGFLVHYLFLQIYFPSQVFDGITQAWSLCTEMSFYFFLPFYAAVLAFKRRSAKSQLVREFVGLGVLVAISFVFRYWVLHLPLITVKNGKFVPICAPNCATKPALASLMIDWLPAYLDLFALGMLLAILSAWFVQHDSEPKWLSHRLMPWISWACAAVTFVIVSHVVTDHDILYLLIPRVNLERQTLYGLFSFFMLVPAVFGPQDQSLIRRLLRCWPMASIGVISYGIYLWHLDLITKFLSWTGWHAGQIPYGILALAVLGLSIAFASASYFGLERPILRYKNRLGWWDRRSRRGRAAADAAVES